MVIIELFFVSSPRFSRSDLWRKEQHSALPWKRRLMMETVSLLRLSVCLSVCLCLFWDTHRFWYLFLSDCSPLSLLKSLGPSAVDLELRGLSPDLSPTPQPGSTSQILLAFLRMLEAMLVERQDFDLAQAYLALFLKVTTLVRARRQQISAHNSLFKISCVLIKGKNQCILSSVAWDNNNQKLLSVLIIIVHILKSYEIYIFFYYPRLHVLFPAKFRPDSNMRNQPKSCSTQQRESGKLRF